MCTLSGRTAPRKERYEWVDNSRIVASFLIMFLHLPLALPENNVINNEVVDLLCHQCVYNGQVAMFLMLSGYLFGRNVSWRKTLNRFFWFLIPYVLWNLIVMAIHTAMHSGEPVSVWRVFGLGAILRPDWIFTPGGSSFPTLNIPSWYMRDMLPLTLLTPLLVRCKKLLLPGVLLFTLFPPENQYMDPAVMMAPSTCCFYVFGVWLTRFNVEDAYRIFNDKSTPLFLLLLVAACIASINQTVFHGRSMQITLIGMLVGAMMIAHCGVMIEQHLPRVSKKLVPLGPASFLVFMIHVPIFHMIHKLCPSFCSTYWVLLLPIPTFIFIVSFFLMMKRYTPWLMPYLGHMRIKKKTAS